MTEQSPTDQGPNDQPGRILLTLDTATGSVVTGVVALTDDGPQVLGSRVVDEHRKHAEILTTLIKESLEEAGRPALDAVIVGCGPGPFTGLRVGMATGAAYADALGLPAYGVCTLDAIAAEQSLADGEDDGDLLVVTDARRREVYWARYAAGTRIAGPDVARPDDLAETAEGRGAAVVAGDPAFTDRFDGRPGTVAVPTPRALAVVGAGLLGTQPVPLTPLYLRRPDAVELKDQRKKSLL